MTAAAAAPPRIKVMIVDDSAVVREVLSAVIGADPGLRVIATAPDPIAARLKMNADWPDVIVLDVEMPRMDGITFLRQLMAERPTPVVICSTLTEKGAKTTMLALSAGAVTFVTKPTLGLRDFLQGQAAEFSRIVRDAARARPRRSVVPATASGAGAAASSYETDARAPPRRYGCRCGRDGERSRRRRRSLPARRGDGAHHRAGGGDRHVHRRHAGA